MSHWPFDVSAESTVVTTTYVTNKVMPILYVSHEEEDGEIVWQFHCGNGDYSPECLLLVRLETVLRLDRTLVDVADLPVGWAARRQSVGQPWEFVAEL